uniref:Ubiquitin-like protease family profile domain-containing protein n=1 Tax=Setaria viridis TaxID=4556 RepID=A0A4U6VGH2_SETVI|nr:hypothetical protein SEVIR_3G336900v2 [Setaria viridis]
MTRWTRKFGGAFGPAHPPLGLSSPSGPSHPAQSLSPTPSNPGGASDNDQNTPPRSPFVVPGLKPGASKEPAAPLNKSRSLRKKTKKSEPFKKLAVDMTPEELEEASQVYVREWFEKNTGERKVKEMEPKPVDLTKLKFFIGLKKEVKKMLLSNYDCSLIIKFMEDTGLSFAKVLGRAEPPPPEKTVPKWPFELGKYLVRPELVRKLSTKMYEFHQWYMEQSAKERLMFILLVKPIDFIGEAEKLLWLEFKDIYEVYHQNTLDVSLISAWVPMQIQRCRRESYFNVDFMDPALVNQQQNYKQYILLPYIFNNVIVLDSLRKPKDVYQDIQDVLNFAWKRFRKHHRGNIKEKLTFNTTFPLWNNLCGYYVCEHMYHFVKDKVISDLITAFGNQEALIEFMVDEVINPNGEFHYDGHSIAEPSNTTTGGS